MTRENEPKKPDWYKHGWGLIIAVLFFPYFIIWYTWARSRWNQRIKVGVTAITAIVILLIGISIATTDTGQKNVNTTKDKPTDVQQQKTDALEQTNTTSAQQAETLKPTESVSQKNAVKKAKSYISILGFSRDGLIAQLEFDQFSNADAIYGADNSGADWNEQAAKKAKSYMDISAFSRGALIAQLEFDKFTPEQATFGADSVGL